MVNGTCHSEFDQHIGKWEMASPEISSRIILPEANGRKIIAGTNKWDFLYSCFAHEDQPGRKTWFILEEEELCEVKINKVARTPTPGNWLFCAKPLTGNTNFVGHFSTRKQVRNGVIFY
jgi:hypothetical protein